MSDRSRENALFDRVPGFQAADFEERFDGFRHMVFISQNGESGTAQTNRDDDG
jgi:hypothetical protein